jgi:SAM-dependent methyltransferase
MSTTNGPWRRHAQQWQWIGPPLRPDVEDVLAAESAVARWSRSRGRAPDALLLGVTPEIATMRWPAGTRLLAVDHSWAMIRGVWPGVPLGFPAVCAEWRALPLPEASRDAILGDGSFSALASGRMYAAVVRALRQVIRDGGVLAMRFYLRPEKPEAPGNVIDDLRHGRIGSFHVFKWRLVMAFHRSLEDGVRLGEVWDAWHDAVPDSAALARRTGWAHESILTIDAYRGVATGYTFPTLPEARAALAGAFEETACTFPSYELGERCPTLIFRPR